MKSIDIDINTDTDTGSSLVWHLGVCQFFVINNNYPVTSTTT